MRNEDVLNNFMRGFDAVNSSKNLISYGTTLFNYNTKIAQHFGGVTVINGHKYSSTTSKHQNALKSYGKSIVLPKDEFFMITEKEWGEAYDLVHEIFDTLANGEYCVDFTLPQKKYQPLKDELQKLLYINKK